MDVFTLSFWGISIALTGLSLVKSKKKTFEAMKKSKGMMGNMLGEIIAIIFIVGCGICVKMMPEVYELIDQKAYARLENVNSGNMTMIHKTVSKYPTQAITINAIGGAS